jgi:hypothetical protein
VNGPLVLRVLLVGRGEEGSPYEVNLPTYRMLMYSPSHRWALVQVPEEVHGLQAEHFDAEDVEETSHGLHLPHPRPETLDALHAHFDQRYQEHAGRFRVRPA